jgi:hypothetical protein
MTCQALFREPDLLPWGTVDVAPPVAKPRFWAQAGQLAAPFALQEAMGRSGGEHPMYDEARCLGST